MIMNNTPKPKIIRTVYSSRDPAMPLDGDAVKLQGGSAKDYTDNKPAGHREKAVGYGLRALKSSGQRFVLVLADDDEFNLFNFCRYQHKPARLDAWAKAALHAHARKTVKEHLAVGHKLSPDIAALVDKFRDC